MAKPWPGGDPPTYCDICKRPLKKVFIDGATRMGPWANMCRECHDEYGVGLGVGRGQEYTLPDFEDNPSATYGEIPTFEEFEQAWEDAGVGDYYTIRNWHGSSYVSDGEYTITELYRLVKRLTWMWLATNDEEAGDAASVILETLGFEWI